MRMITQKSPARHRGVWTTGGIGELPSLDKEGWLRPFRKCCEASLAGADGHERSECEPDRAKQERVVGSSHRLSDVERTILPCFALSGSHSLRSCPAAPPKERDHVFDGAAAPPLPRKGVRVAIRLFSVSPYSLRAEETIHTQRRGSRAPLAQ